MAAQPPPFALAPALVRAGNPIDYSTYAGQHLYTAARNPLPYTFTGQESSLPAFLQAIHDRASQAGWDDIFQITIGNDAVGNAITRDLLTHYGEISLKHVHNDAALDYIGQQVRNAQCLKSSINEDVTERMVTEIAN